MELTIIARIHCDLPTKFGVPRQSGLAPSLGATVVFEPPYRNVQALRGLDGFTHLWIIWGFHLTPQNTPKWHPTVRPPRLGGNVRMGVFATRSPFRPNPLGLSCVELLGVENSAEHGPVLHISGADMTDGTPVYDIKPYLPQSDCITRATGGFAQIVEKRVLEVVYRAQQLEVVPEGKRAALLEILGQDPRPAYQDSPERIYGFDFSDFEVRFTVEDNRLYIVSVERR